MKPRKRQEVRESRGLELGAQLRCESRTIAHHERRYQLARLGRDRSLEAVFDRAAPAAGRGARRGERARREPAHDQGSPLRHDPVGVCGAPRRATTRVAGQRGLVERGEQLRAIAPLDVARRRQSHADAGARRHRPQGTVDLDHGKRLVGLAPRMIHDPSRVPPRSGITVEIGRGSGEPCFARPSTGDAGERHGGDQQSDAETAACARSDDAEGHGKHHPHRCHSRVEAPAHQDSKPQ